MLALAYEINCTASHATCEEVLLNTAAKRLAELSALACGTSPRVRVVDARLLVAVNTAPDDSSTLGFNGFTTARSHGGKRSRMLCTAVMVAYSCMHVSCRSKRARLREISNEELVPQNATPRGSNRKASVGIPR